MIYFVADIHLGAGAIEEQKRVESSFLRFLHDIEGDASVLVLMGDIFDFWFEYKEVVPKGFVRVLGRLAELCDKGVRVIMLTGNHDMWVGDYLSKECGIELYTKPQIFSLAGKRLFVAHGDNMNIGKQPILRLMNKMFRSKGLRKCVSRIVHPDTFIRFGKWWSGKSRKAHYTPQSGEVLQPLIDYATEFSRGEEDIDYYLFGHMHYISDECREPRIFFLGDWHTQPNYLVLNDEGKMILNKYNK